MQNMKKEMSGLWTLAFPIIGGHLVQMLMGLIDLWMVGKVSVLALAVVAFANSAMTVFYLFGIGIILPIAMLSSHAHGAGNRREAGEILRHGLFLAVIVSSLLAAFLHWGYPLLSVLKQPEDVFQNAKTFTRLVAWSMVPTLLAAGIKQCSEALSKPWMPFFIMLGSVGLNAFLNWLLIYGNWGFPPMGVNGAGLATLLARIISAVMMVVYFIYTPIFVEEMPERWFAKIDCERLKQLWKLGFPTAIQMVAESGAFAAAAFMMGWMGTQVLAAHQIAINYAAFTFMLPLGLAGALTIRIGQVIGAGEHGRQREVFLCGILCSVAISILTTIVFLTCRYPLAELIVDRSLPDADAVVSIAATILIVAGLFQLVDGIQVVCLGSLRGLHDVKTPMRLGIFCYWGVALPVGAILAFKIGKHATSLTTNDYFPEWMTKLNLGFGLGPTGIWMGLAFGLGCAAVLLFRRFWKKTE